MTTHVRNLALTFGIIAASIAAVFGFHVVRVAVAAYTITPPKTGTVSGDPIHHGFTPVTTAALPLAPRGPVSAGHYWSPGTTTVARHTVKGHRALTRV